MFSSALHLFFDVRPLGRTRPRAAWQPAGSGIWVVRYDDDASVLVGGAKWRLLVVSLQRAVNVTSHMSTGLHRSEFGLLPIIDADDICDAGSGDVPRHATPPPHAPPAATHAHFNYTGNSQFQTQVNLEL